MKIANSIALVTGGCGSLGLPICQRLANQGSKVIIADINEESLNKLPSNFYKKKLNVCDSDEAKKVASEIVQEYGHIDLLVNCAGKIISSPLVNIFSRDNIMLSYEQFREELSINLDSVFIVTSAIVEQMVRNRTKGCIISISSISANGNAGQTSYSAAKAAVNAMTVTWAKELGPFGIRFNAVAPGFIETPSTSAALNAPHIKHIVDSTPLRRLGRPDEVAQAVQFLAENEFCNGVILDINGGLSI